MQIRWACSPAQVGRKRASQRDYDAAKRLARVLYAYYEGRGDSESASNYNHLVTEWPYISEAMGLPGQTEELF